MSSWFVWLIVALVLGALETLTLTLVLGMFSVGALAAMLFALLGADEPVQVLAFVIVSVALLIFVRPVARRHLRSPAPKTGTASLVGFEAVTLSEIGPHGGRVRLNGGEWSARTAKNESIEVGAVVEVIQIDGATAVVRREVTPEEQ